MVGAPPKPPAPDHNDTSFAFSVLQAEAGLVALSHLGAIEAQQVVVGEYFHAVVVSVSKEGPRSGSAATAACKLQLLSGNLTSGDN